MPLNTYQINTPEGKRYHVTADNFTISKDNILFFIQNECIGIAPSNSVILKVTNPEILEKLYPKKTEKVSL